MKQWTKNNMQLLSKLRAKKTTITSPRQNDPYERAITPRQLAAVEEAETPVKEGGPSYYNPLALACCAADNTASITGNNSTTAAGSSSSSAAQQTNSQTGYNAPYDESSAQQQKQQQQQQLDPSQNENQQQQPRPQPHIITELFLFFRKRSWKKKLFTLLVVLTILPVLLDIFILRTNKVTDLLDTFLEWMAEHPLLGVWAYIVMVTLTSLIFVPPSILIFAAGFTFQSLWGGYGIFIALVSSYLGSMMGGLIGFWRAKYMTRDLIEVLMRRYPIIKAVDAAIVKNSLRVMLLMRLNCLIPFGVLNYVFGITGVDWEAFVLAMVGILPWHLTLVCLGASSASMYDDDGWMEVTLVGVILYATGIAFGIIGLVITWRYAKKELQKEVDSTPPITAGDYRMRDMTLSPSRSKNRKFPSIRAVGNQKTTASSSAITEQPNPGAISVDEADLYTTDYFLIQWCGEDRATVMANNVDQQEQQQVVEKNYGMEEGDDDQSKLTWNEIILDDFS